MDSENPRTGANGAGASAEATTSPSLISILKGVPPITILRAMASNRAELGALVDTAIEIMNRVDGDPDIELNGDEQDSDGDERGDQAWAEWNTLRGSQKHRPNILLGHEDDEEDDAPEEDDPQGACDEDEISTNGTLRESLFTSLLGRGPGCEISDHAEEDDPSGQSDEDGVNTGGVPRFGWGGPAGAGCPISDPDAEHDGRENDDGV